MTDSKQDLYHEDLQYTAWRQCEKTITFDGGTADAIGDYDGTGDPFTIFTVTGEVAVKVYAICTTSIVGAATLEVGVTGATAGIIAQIADAEDLDVSELWHDATPDAGVEAASVVAEKVIVNGLDIIGNIGTANITAGVIRFVCLWKPISKNGNVVPA